MPTQVQDVAELDSEKVAQSLAFISTLTQEEHPSVDVRFGVVHNLLLVPSAEHAAANQENIDRYNRSSSLKTINEDPSLADNDMVDAVVSNKGIERQAGTPADGNITIVVSELAPVTIAAGTEFIGNGKAFVPLETFSAKTSAANVDAATDRVLDALGDGNYSFTIPVQAVESGSASLIKKDTLLETEAVINNLVKIYATSDFVGGVNTETNAQLMLREQEGIAAQALCNRVNGAAVVREAFPSYVSISMIGLGDAEMLRDRHTIFPGSFGGRSDWYFRSAELPPAITIVKEATLIEKQSDNRGIWQFTIIRDDAPGFYDTLSITPNEEVAFVGTFPLQSQVRSSDLTPILGELLPDIDEAVESVYSRFQSVTIQFKDTETDVSAMTVSVNKQDYRVTIRSMPQIAELQSLLAGRSHRNYFGDVLVKAPVPCYVSLAFQLLGKPGAAVPDVFAIKAALATYVNRIPFTGRLYATALADIIHNYLPDGVQLSAVDMLGNILRPNGTVKTIRSTEVLVVPDEPGNMVSARTVGFILDSSDVLVSAATINVPEIL